ncbi:hypothetical protein BGZ98_003862 [Dissophora globulifera]|nr:hypothetical protein BGZ98_003862 [Dissophora globulifera]
MAPRIGGSDEAGFKRLVELETEYRTQRSADQLHAIASFPHLFDECPYPVIINAAKSTETSHKGGSNNIQRHAILQVFKKSQPHLKKVINVEETIKRISPMLQSNDPLARAITLRVLGCMATIASDRIDVYHNVIHSLDSTEAMEVSAAVYAADMICAQSQRFCAIISGKLAFMVRDKKTPLPLRRRLIRIFGHMFEDITLARLARKTCLDILELNQDGEYTVAILRTLTRLASHSLVDVDQQIELLLQWAQDQTQSQPGIRRVALMCLGSLAQKNTEFSPSQIKTCLQILERSFTSFESSPSSSSSGASTRLVVLECYEVLAAILPYYRQFEDAGFQSDVEPTFREATAIVTQSIEKFLIRILSIQIYGGRAAMLAKETADQSKTMLRSLVALTLEADSGVGELMKTILSWIETYKDVSALLAKALLHIVRQQPAKADTLQDTMLTYLENNVDSPDTQTFILVYRALLESAALHHTTTAITSSTISPFESRVSQLVERFGQMDMLEQFTRNHWELYQLGRYALQTGWPVLALTAFRNQEKRVKAVSAALWMMGVQTMATIESSLQNTSVSGTRKDQGEEGEGEEDGGRLDLYSQQHLYIKVMGYLEELEVHQVDRTFHLQFCGLRRNYLQTCQTTAATLHLLSTSLATARQHALQHVDTNSSSGSHSTATSILAATTTLPGDEVALYRCAEKFNQLAHQYTLLRASVSSASSVASGNLSSLDTPAIGGTLAGRLGREVRQSDSAIEILQTMCLILAYAVQRVAKIVGRISDTTGRASGNSGHMETMQEDGVGKDNDDDDDDDVFDIDPLLIPLLFLQEQEQEQQMQQQEGGDGLERQMTFLEVFKASMRMTLGFVDGQVKGRNVDALEKGVSIAQQLLSQYISFPVPIPQEFFVTAQPLQSGIHP